jgi:hypothetical protein
LLNLLFDRDENGGSMLSEDGRYAYRIATRSITKLLHEAEENNPVDLRDLSSIIKDAVDDVIKWEVIRRRLL